MPGIRLQLLKQANAPALNRPQRTPPCGSRGSHDPLWSANRALYSRFFRGHADRSAALLFVIQVQRRFLICHPTEIRGLRRLIICWRSGEVARHSPGMGSLRPPRRFDAGRGLDLSTVCFSDVYTATSFGRAVNSAQIASSVCFTSSSTCCM